MDNLYSFIRGYANSTGADPDSSVDTSRYRQFVDTLSGDRHVVEVLDETEYEVISETNETNNN